MIDIIVHIIGYTGVAFFIWLIFEMAKEFLDDIKEKYEKK